MAIAGAGAGVNELTALAATSEMAPTRKRGVYVAVLIFTILPFCPSVLWAQLIAYYSSWRYVGAFSGAWNAFGLLITILFYYPPPRENSVGLSRREVIKRIDFVGGFLSITGLIIFLAGLQWGGYMVCCLTVGVLELLLTCYDSVVCLEFRPCPRTPDHWFPAVGGFRILGDLWCQVPNLPNTFEARASDFGSYPGYHLHFWLQFLLRPDVLAH